DNGNPANAQLNGPSCVLPVGADVVFICDRGNHVIRKVQGGVITTVAGVGASAGFNGDGNALQTLFNHPSDIAFDAAGNLGSSDGDNNRIRRLNTDGTVTTLAGTGATGYAGENVLATGSSIAGPAGITVAPNGTVVFAEGEADRIRGII